MAVLVSLAPLADRPLALIHGHATVPAGLVACTPDGGVQCLVEGTYGVVPTSETRTTDRVLGAASGFPARASRAIRLRLPPANRPYDSRSTTVGHGPLPRIRLALTLLIRRGRKAVRDAFTESYWSVGAVKVPVESVMDGSVTGELIDWYPTADADTYVADPFPLPSDSRAVYVEEFDHMTRHGRLAVMTYSEEEGWSNTRVVADEVFHMSYPYMFEYEGETLCVPESGWNNAVSIYRAQHPRPLEKACDILTGLAAGDPTVFWWDGHWWIFYTDCLEPRDTDLYIFYSSSPWGPWQPHLRNPVKSDISSEVVGRGAVRARRQAAASRAGRRRPVRVADGGQRGTQTDASRVRGDAGHQDRTVRKRTLPYRPAHALGGWTVCVRRRQTQRCVALPQGEATPQKHAKQIRRPPRLDAGGQ